MSVTCIQDTLSSCAALGLRLRAKVSCIQVSYVPYLSDPLVYNIPYCRSLEQRYLAYKPN